MWEAELIDPEGGQVDHKGQRLIERGDGDVGRDRVLAEMLGRPAAGLCTFGEIFQAMERLRFIERRGAPPGFLTTLPRGVAFGAVVDVLNATHVESLRAARVDFPLVFDHDVDDMRDLTSTYEQQDRMFQLAGADSHLRLAYAADPGFFSWLRGRTLDSSKLPYAVYSPLPAFRRRQSGEQGLRALSQYSLPDIHVVCLSRDARRVYLQLVAASVQLARFFFGEAWAQFIEIAPELNAREPDLPGAAAIAANQYTVRRPVRRADSYYIMKGGINVDTGGGSLMLFNFQWDEVNPVRFQFSSPDGPVAVIHATAAGGVAKVLPLIIGRGLSGMAPRRIPVELSPTQVVVLPLTPSHESHAMKVVNRLGDLGLRAEVGPSTGEVRKRINMLRRAWNPYHVVVGDHEVDGTPLQFRSPNGAPGGPPEEILRMYGPRLDACRVPRTKGRFDVPFAT